jgi:hypothetical protein
MNRVPLLVAITLGAAGCTPNTDPAAGGFINGIAGVTTGAYEERIAAGEASVAEAQARNDALRAEQSDLAGQIGATERQLASARLTLLNQRDAVSTLDAATADRVNRALTAQPTASTDAGRLAELQQLLSETSALSQELAGLGA